MPVWQTCNFFQFSPQSHSQPVGWVWKSIQKILISRAGLLARSDTGHVILTLIFPNRCTFSSICRCQICLYTFSTMERIPWILTEARLPHFFWNKSGVSFSLPSLILSLSFSLSLSLSNANIYIAPKVLSNLYFLTFRVQLSHMTITDRNLSVGHCVT